MKRPRIPIIARILGFNLLLVFVPVASFLSLDSYEKSLLAALEDSLVQQGRLLAAWLAEGPLTEERAAAALAALERRHTARLRVLDGEGRLLADSSALQPIGADEPAAAADQTYGSLRSASGTAAGTAAGEPAAHAPEATSNPLYRFFSGLARLYRRFAPPQEALPSADFYARGRNFLEGQEVRSALAGRYGAATRISAGGQVSVTLYSALPVGSAASGVRGAVLASQSTYRILSSLYRLRLEVARIFILSLGASTALSVLLWITIARPLKRLRDRSRSALTLPSLAEGHFARGRVSDEIDDLAATLREFSSRLGERLSWAEDFASDLAHEIRNPLASIRASAELLEGAEKEEEALLRRRIAEDCDRVNRIVEGLRELSRIEAEEGEREDADLLDCVENSVRRAAEGAEAREKGLRLRVAAAARDLRAALAPERLGIALAALLDNAVSFSPPGEEILVQIKDAAGSLSVSVLDRGPGLPPGDEGRLFERFFTTRPGAAKRPAGAGADQAPVGGAAHCGLGLAMVDGIARRAGGRAEASNRPGGGARFTLILPRRSP